MIRRRPESLCSPVCIAVAVAVLCLPLPAHGSAEGRGAPDVRLLLSEQLGGLTLQGQGLTVHGELSTGWREVVSGVQAAAFELSGSRIRLKGSPMRARRYRVVDDSGLVTWKGRRWRGALGLVRDRTGISLVNTMGLETYLVGLVNGEISSRWPLEAVKAQVVAARTYALYRMAQADGFYDLKIDISDQVYAGVAGEDARARAAVKTTRGLALYVGDSLVPAFYHSSCGGSTSDAFEVWGLDHPALAGTACGECGDSPRSTWEVFLTMAEVGQVIRGLFPASGRPVRLGVHHRTKDGRVTALFADTDRGRILIDADDFRRTVGYFRLPSTRFRIYSQADRVFLEGGGFGHGIGLCQWGGRGLAIKGASFSAILERYYPGSSLKRVYR